MRGGGRCPSRVPACCSAGEEIDTAVREVLKGRFYISPVVAWGVVDVAMEVAARHRGTGEPAAGAQVAEILTPRELATARLVGQGLSNKEIARCLGVTVTTVRCHLNKAYGKLGLASRVELALLVAPPGGTVV